MNTRIPAGRGTPPTKELSTDNNRRRWRGGVGITLTQPSTYLEIQLNGGEITQKKQLNKSKRQSSKPCSHGRTSFNTTCPHQHNWIQEVVDGVTLSEPTGGKDPPKKDQQQSKPKDIQRAIINNSSRPVSSGSGDQEDCTTESHRFSTIEVHTINPGRQNRSI